MRNPRPRESLIRTPKPRPSSSVEAASICGEADPHPKTPTFWEVRTRVAERSGGGGGGSSSRQGDLTRRERGRGLDRDRHLPYHRPTRSDARGTVDSMAVRSAGEQKGVPRRRTAGRRRGRGQRKARRRAEGHARRTDQVERYKRTSVVEVQDSEVAQFPPASQRRALSALTFSSHLSPLRTKNRQRGRPEESDSIPELPTPLGKSEPE